MFQWFSIFSFIRKEKNIYEIALPYISAYHKSIKSYCVWHFCVPQDASVLTVLDNKRYNSMHDCVLHREQQYNWEGSLCRQTRDGFEPLSQFIPKASNKMLLLWPIMQTNSEKWMYLPTFSTKFQPCPWLILLYKILWLWIGPYAVHYLAALKSKFRFALILSGQICPPQKAISTASIAQFPNKACKVAQSAKLFVSTITSKP